MADHPQVSGPEVPSFRVRNLPSRLIVRWRTRHLATPLQTFHRERRARDWDAFDSFHEFNRQFGPGAATLGPFRRR